MQLQLHWKDPEQNSGIPFSLLHLLPLLPFGIDQLGNFDLVQGYRILLE